MKPWKVAYERLLIASSPEVRACFPEVGDESNSSAKAMAFISKLVAAILPTYEHAMREAAANGNWKATMAIGAEQVAYMICAAEAIQACAADKNMKYVVRDDGYLDLVGEGITN